MEKILEVKNIEKYYGNKSNLTKAIDNISFNVNKGEFVGIMGASGSGKTTLLNCISTIDRVTAGHIIINGEDITKLKGNKLNKFRREELGFIFQDFNLLDTLTCYENIALALTIQRVKPQEIDKRISEIAEKLEIKEILKKYPYQVSGGQKQRVASARAIITYPKLVLADEPTGALDSKSARQLLENFELLNKKIMLKRIILLLLIIAPMSVFAQKFGHFRSQEILALMPEVTKAQAELETMKKQFEDDMKLIQEEFVKKYTAFQQEQATLPKNILDRRQKDLEDMRAKTIQTEQDYAQQLNQKQAELMQPIFKKLNDAIMAVGQEGGYIYILDMDVNFNPATYTPILFANDTLSTNVTEAVKAKLGIK